MLVVEVCVDEVLVELELEVELLVVVLEEVDRVLLVVLVVVFPKNDVVVEERV